MTKRGKRGTGASEAAQSFWACVLHNLSADDVCAKLPTSFASPGEYYASLAALVLAESRALSRAVWARGFRGKAAELTAGELSLASPCKAAQQRGVRQKILTIKGSIQARMDWPVLRVAWLVELVVKNEAALFFLARRQDSAVELWGFAPERWRWCTRSGCAQTPLQAQMRPVEDLVPLLRMWTACFLSPKVPFLHQLMGKKGATHQIFSDSEDEPGSSDSPRQQQTPCPGEVSVPQAPQIAGAALNLNMLQQEAVTRILASDGLMRRCHLLQGPPGTGKTRAVVALLQQLYLRAEADSRILISAPSNGAVQVALESFLNTKEGRACSLCLVGVEDKVPAEGPLRSAFIHTRVQNTLRLLQKCKEDSSHLPEALQALSTLQRSVPSAFRRLKLPKGRLTASQLLNHVLEKELTLASPCKARFRMGQRLWRQERK
ncbi:unnamed protein product [Effrenium voratum]|nr:unnamed protein product [Effrenium voratum]